MAVVRDGGLFMRSSVGSVDIKFVGIVSWKGVTGWCRDVVGRGNMELLVVMGEV
jgi:hypothetical protein